MSGLGERDGDGALGLQADVHVAAMEVARGDVVRATLSVRAPAGSSPRRAEWGAPVTGGIRRPGAPEPSGWFSGRVAGVGRWATLDPEHPIAMAALIGTTAVLPGRVLPPGVYQVVVHVLLSLGREQFRLEAVGPEIYLV